MFETAIRANPGFAKAYNNLGALYGRRGEYDKGIACFKKAAGINPRDVDALFNLGLAYERTNNNKKATVFFEQALKVNPAYARAHHRLAWLYYREKRPGKAIEHCGKAKKSGYPVDTELLRLLRDEAIRAKISHNTDGQK